MKKANANQDDASSRLFSSPPSPKTSNQGGGILRKPGRYRNLFQLAWIAVVAVGIPSAIPAEPNTIALPRIFGHNMVLQRETSNLFWGKAEPKAYVAVQFGDLAWSCAQADKAGDWRLELDLRQVSDSPVGKLCFSTGAKKKVLHPVLVLTNVAVGDVLLMGVLGKGIPYQLPAEEAERKEWLRRAAPQIQYLRFATFPGFDGLKSGCAAQPGAWQLCVPDSDDFQQLSALAFIWAFTQANRPLGIIQTEPTALGEGLPARLAGHAWKGREKRRLELSDNRLAAYMLATNQVAMVQQRNEQILIEAKRQGLVTNLPPVVQYDQLDVYMREEFDRAKPPGSVLTFDAGIW